MTIGEMIMLQRRRLKLSRKDLENAIGLAQNTVSLYEADKYIPKPDVLIKICRVLEIDPHVVYDGIIKKNEEVQDATFVHNHSGATAGAERVCERRADEPLQSGIR